MRILVLTAAAAFFAVSSAQAGLLKPVEDETAKVECSDCHMAYPPIVLPQSSWELIFDNLANHYGEDASLDDATTKHLRDYYVANSNDVIKASLQGAYDQKVKEAVAAGKNPKYVRPPGIMRTASKWSSSGTPKRIQDVHRFKTKHSFSQVCQPIIEGVMKRAKIKSLALCSGCHAGMPTTGSTGVQMKFMENMTEAERQNAMTDEERRCLDD